MKLTSQFTMILLVCGSVVAGGCDFGGDDGKDTGGADVQETDTSVGEDTNAGVDTNVGADTTTGPVTAATCREIVTIADLNANLTSDLGEGATWAWLASVEETGRYDVDTSTQLYAICAEVFRCESGMWGQLEVMIFAAADAPPWLNGVKGLTTQLSGIGSEAWEYPIRYGVVFWKGDYAVCLAVRSGFNKSWTQEEIDAYAAVVAAKL